MCFFALFLLLLVSVPTKIPKKLNNNTVAKHTAPENLKKKYQHTQNTILDGKQIRIKSTFYSTHGIVEHKINKNI